MSVEHSSNREQINGQLRQFSDSLDVEIRIQEQKNKGVADLLTDFKKSCERRLTQVVQAATISQEPQRLAALSVDMSVKSERWRIINDTLEALIRLIENASLSLGGSSYKLNEFILVEKEDSAGFDDETIIVDFVLPASVRRQLRELDISVATAEPLAPSPERTVDRNVNKNAVFAERLPQLLIGVDAELAELIIAAVQRTPGSGNIYAELPVGRDRKTVRAQLNARFGGVAYAQNYSGGANAIQITVN